MTSTPGCPRGDLLVTTSAGGAVTQLTPAKTLSACQAAQPAWSPDGRWLAFHAAARSGYRSEI